MSFIGLAAPMSLICAKKNQMYFKLEKKYLTIWKLKIILPQSTILKKLPELAKWKIITYFNTENLVGIEVVNTEDKELQPLEKRSTFWGNIPELDVNKTIQFNRLQIRNIVNIAALYIFLVSKITYSIADGILE